MRRRDIPAVGVLIILAVMALEGPRMSGPVRVVEVACGAVLVLGLVLHYLIT